MVEFYPQIRLVHICAVLASGGIFLLRGTAVQLGLRGAMAAPVRYLSYSIDSVLLTSALMLITVLHQYPFVQAWLTVKLALIIVYVVAGSFALKRGRTPRVRLVCFVAALLIFGFTISVARTHQPLGAMHWILE